MSTKEALLAANIPADTISKLEEQRMLDAELLASVTAGELKDACSIPLGDAVRVKRLYPSAAPVATPTQPTTPIVAVLTTPQPKSDEEVLNGHFRCLVIETLLTIFSRNKIRRWYWVSAGRYELHWELVLETCFDACSVNRPHRDDLKTSASERLPALRVAVLNSQSCCYGRRSDTLYSRNAKISLNTQESDIRPTYRPRSQSKPKIGLHQTRN